MIAVAPHQIGELAQAFRIRRHHARLIEHQHAQLVAGVEQFRRGRIVRGAQRVAAHLLQLANAVVLHRIGQRRAHAGVVLVIAGSLQLDRLAVQEESLLRVERDRANAEAASHSDRQSRCRSAPRSPACRDCAPRATRAAAASPSIFCVVGLLAAVWQSTPAADLPCPPCDPAGPSTVEITRTFCA